MASEKMLMDLIEKLESDVNGIIAVAAVDLESGMTLASKSNRGDFDLTVASAYNSELVKQKMKIMKALDLRTSLEDMVLTLGDQIHVIKLFPGNSAFWYIAADRGATNLAILRNAIAKLTVSLD